MDHVLTPESEGEDLYFVAGPGAILADQYRLDRLFGYQGGEGLWAATDLLATGDGGGERTVLVKLYPGSDSHAQSRDWVATLAALTNDHVVRVRKFGRVKSSAFMVTDMVAGERLDRWIELHPLGLPISQAAPILRGLADAFTACHDRGIVLRTVCPEHICFHPRSGEVKLFNFDLPVGDSDTIAASRVYASPECLEGQIPSAADDVFSFACIAYELLSGRHPFDRLDAVTAAKEKRSPARLDCLPAEQARMLSRALALTRHERTLSLRELAPLFEPADGSEADVGAGAPADVQGIPAAPPPGPIPPWVGSTTSGRTSAALDIDVGRPGDSSPRGAGGSAAQAWGPGALPEGVPSPDSGPLDLRGDHGEHRGSAGLAGVFSKLGRAGSFQGEFGPTDGIRPQSSRKEFFGSEAAQSGGSSDFLGRDAVPPDNFRLEPELLDSGPFESQQRRQRESERSPSSGALAGAFAMLAVGAGSVLLYALLIREPNDGQRQTAEREAAAVSRPALDDHAAAPATSPPAAGISEPSPVASSRPAQQEAQAPNPVAPKPPASALGSERTPAVDGQRQLATNGGPAAKPNPLQPVMPTLPTRGFTRRSVTSEWKEVPTPSVNMQAAEAATAALVHQAVSGIPRRVAGAHRPAQSLTPAAPPPRNSVDVAAAARATAALAHDAVVARANAETRRIIKWVQAEPQDQEGGPGAGPEN